MGIYRFLRTHARGKVDKEVSIERYRMANRAKYIDKKKSIETNRSRYIDKEVSNRDSVAKGGAVPRGGCREAGCVCVCILDPYQTFKYLN